MAEKESEFIQEVYYSPEEIEETILFLNSFLYHESEHKTGNATTSHCYIKETIKMLEKSNILRCDYRFFKYFNKDSGDDCKRLEYKTPSKRSAVKNVFKALNKRIISYFDKNYNRNSNFKISTEGFYVKVVRVPNIVESQRNRHYQKKKESQNEKSSTVLDYKYIFDFYKWVNLILVLIFPIRHTVRRFSNIELISTAIAFHLIACLSARQLVENTFGKILADHNTQQFFANANRDVQQQLQVMFIDIIKVINMFVEIGNISKLLIAILFATVVFASANKIFKFSRATYGELFFIFMNTYSIVLLVFGLISYRLLSPYGQYKILIFIICTAYFVIYPVFSTKHLLNLRFRESIGAYVALLFLVGVFKRVIEIVF